jgi:segregation and condensation protein B
VSNPADNPRFDDTGEPLEASPVGDVGVDRLREAFDALDAFDALEADAVGAAPEELPGAAPCGDAAALFEPGDDGPEDELADALDAGPREHRLPRLPEGSTLEGVLEALLLVADGPLALKDLTEVLDGCDWVPVRRALRSLRGQYRERQAGVEIVEVAGGWRMVTRPLYAEHVEKLRTVEREERLSHAQLETLAIIAYRQPVIRSRIDSIRGADSSGVLRALIDKGLVRVAGRADQLGRPFLYGTTSRFLERFGLKSLKALPRGKGS